VEEQKASRPVRRLSPVWNIAAAVIAGCRYWDRDRVASPVSEGQAGTVATATHHGDSTDALVFYPAAGRVCQPADQGVNYADNMTPRSKGDRRADQYAGSFLIRM